MARARISTSSDDGAPIHALSVVLPLSVAAPPADAPRTAPPSIEDVYDEHADTVARMARGLGVPVTALDDVVQDVFLVVHRKLPSFEGRAQIKTWIAGIVVNVVRAHRRAHAKRRALDPIEDEQHAHPSALTPDEAALQRQAVAILESILESMPDDQRVVFVLSEIEEIEMSDIAETLGINVNTGYSRLRLARKIYERGVERARAREDWRER